MLTSIPIWPYVYGQGKVMQYKFIKGLKKKNEQVGTADAAQN